MITTDFQDNFTVHAEKLTLYHGSGIPGIRDFKPAQSCTFGKGLYCTSQRDKAEGYARWRVHSSYGGDLYPDGIEIPATFKPVVYEFMLKYARLADFRTPDGMKCVLPNWQTFLEVIYGKFNHGRPWHCKISNELVAITDLTYKVSRDYSTPVHRNDLLGRGYGGNINSVFTVFLKRKGFDGLIANEGGEGIDGFEIGSHDSYVIFDQSELEIMAETQVQERCESAVH